MYVFEEVFCHSLYSYILFQENIFPFILGDRYLLLGDAGAGLQVSAA